MGGLPTGKEAPPLLGEHSANEMYSLPQALNLTSIVIGFGITAFFTVLAYKVYKTNGTDDNDDSI